MFDLLKARWRQGMATTRFPEAAAVLPPNFRGLPHLKPERCLDGRKDCGRVCQSVCPTDAIALSDLPHEPPLVLDLGRCLLCPACSEVCPVGAITLTDGISMATREREELLLTGAPMQLAKAVDAEAQRIFGRSLKLRQVSAAGCNGCESELNALGNIVFDLGRFGIQFVASPRHADGLLITGPVSHNMRQALWETWEAVPDPRLVIAVGACAISGGPFEGGVAVCDGVPPEIPIDLYIPGCPPHPLTILDGLLRLLGRL